MSCNEQMYGELPEEAREEWEEFIESAVASSVRNAVQNILADMECILPDGTHVIPKKYLRLTSPDKTKMLLCYGGLRVEDTSRFSGRHYPDGWGLVVQTAADAWDMLYIYSTKDEAIAALEKVKNALDDHLETLDL